MEECEPAIKIRSDLRYSNISDSDLGFLVSKAKLVQEESEVKLEFYKIVADICDLDYVDMAKRKTLIQQVEVFINLINLEVLRREKLVQFSQHNHRPLQVHLHFLLHLLHQYLSI